MASTAWTARREDLVKDLAAARAERQAAVDRMEAARAEAARLTAELEVAQANRDIAVTTLQAVQAAVRRQRLEAVAATLPPDPNAYENRMTLYRALQEKP